MKHEEPIKANHNWIITTKTCHVKNTKFSAIASERLKKGIKGTSKGKILLSSLSMEELTKLRKKNNFCRLCLWIHICTNQEWCLLKMDNFDQIAVSMMATIEFSCKKTNFSDIYEKLIFVNSHGFDQQSKRATTGCIFSDGSRLGVICFMHEPLIEIGFKACFGRFRFSSRWITNAPLPFVPWIVDEKWEKLKCLSMVFKFMEIVLYLSQLEHVRLIIFVQWGMLVVV